MRTGRTQHGVVRERLQKANLEEYEDDVLDQRLSQFLKAFRNSVILPSMLLTSNRYGSS